MYIVTGCAGFIGSYVAKRLLEAGEKVLGIDELNDSTDQRLKRWRLEQIRRQGNFTMFKADIAETETVNGIAAEIKASGGKVTAVLNMAGRAGVQPSVDDPQLYIHTNVTGTLNMMELCRKLRVQKFVSASSSSVYGNSSIGPTSEDSPTNKPLSPYAASKKASEVLAHSYHHMHGLDISMLRFFTVYGPAGRLDMSVLRFIRWIVNGTPLVLYGDGSQERDFTYVDDISRGVLAALKPVGYETFNLGSDSPVRMSTLIAMIEEISGKKAVIDQNASNRADVNATWANVCKARRVLGWEARTPLEQGIRNTVGWYLENRELVDSLDLGVRETGQKRRRNAA